MIRGFQFILIEKCVACKQHEKQLVAIEKTWCTSTGQAHRRQTRRLAELSTRQEEQLARVTATRLRRRIDLARRRHDHYIAAKPTQPATRNTLLFAFISKQFPSTSRHIIQRNTTSSSNSQLCTITRYSNVLFNLIFSFEKKKKKSKEI